MKILGIELPLPKKYPLWFGVVLSIATIAALVWMKGGGSVANGCLSNQVYCPGVGCVSGKDKCVPMNPGGPSAVFSKEAFTQPCKPMKQCPGGTRTDGPCLMEFA
jgi:hypothetical protein